MASPKTKKQGKKYHLDFSLTFVSFAGLILFLLLGWIFVLGILVGRGFLPKEVKTLSALKAPITKFQDIVTRKPSSDLDVIKDADKDPKFAFYDELSKKKEEVARKVHPRVRKSVVQPVPVKKPDEKPDRPIKATKKWETGKKAQPGVKKSPPPEPAKKPDKPVRLSKAVEPGKKTQPGIKKSPGRPDQAKKPYKKPDKPVKLSKADKKTQPVMKKASRQTRPSKPDRASRNVVYALQIASLEHEVAALGMVNRLTDLGFPAYYYKIFIKGKAYYRVRCGPFGTRKEAGEFQRLLAKNEKIKSFVSRIAK